MDKPIDGFQTLVDKNVINTDTVQIDSNDNNDHESFTTPPEPSEISNDTEDFSQSRSHPSPNSSVSSDPLQSSSIINTADTTISIPDAESTNDPPSAEENALLLFEGKSALVSHVNAAAFLGDSGEERGLIRVAYMNLFEWTNLSVLASLRALCDKLYMKAESQQLDRLVDAFSDRWCFCNPQHGFKSPSIVYTLAYSILLLNTDHHSEEYRTSKKMSRSLYVQTTLDTMKSLLNAVPVEHAPTIDNSSSFETNSIASTNRGRRTSSDSFSYRQPKSSGLKLWGTNSSNSNKIDNASLVCDTCKYALKEWEAIIIQLLKSVYTSVVLNPLNLAAGQNDASLDLQHSSLKPQSSFSSFTRSRQSSSSGQSLLMKLNSNRRTSWVAPDSWSDYDYQGVISGSSTPVLSKRRSLYGDGLVDTFTKNFFSSNHSSSTIELNDRSYDHNETNSGIGFAGALWNTIIKEEQEKAEVGSIVAADNDNSVDISLSGTNSHNHDVNQRVEEELSLHGPPWAKEGLVKYQSFVSTSSLSKKYKKRDWIQVFVVVQNGYLKMFRFDIPRKKSITESESVVGAGNWLDNATLTHNISLCHTVSQLQVKNSTKDGFQWSLTLPTQGLLLFQTGTKEISEEYVYSCNYWAAKVSKEPLLEAVTSVEYGWDRPLNIYKESDGKCGVSSESFDVVSVGNTRIQIKEWRPPVLPTMFTVSDEKIQLEGLRKHSESVASALYNHNASRSLMIKVFKPSYLVSARAHSNWQKKSQHLLKEAIKYELYITTLQRALDDREKIGLDVRM